MGPLPIKSVGFFSKGRKFLTVMTGAVTIGVCTRLCTYIYRWISMEYENMFCERV